MFATPYPYAVVETNDDYVAYQASLNDGSTLYLDMTELTYFDTDTCGIFAVEFSRGNSFSVTSCGDVPRVMATVIKMIGSAVEALLPPMVLFSADCKSRQKLYSRLVKRFMSTFNYRYIGGNEIPNSITEKECEYIRKTYAAEDGNMEGLFLFVKN